MKNRKKGQVALEFLMTYGWAFLIILVVIGAFIYFDVLNPQRTIPGRCTLTAGLYCNAYSVTTGNIQLEVRNDMGRTIDIEPTSSLTSTLGGLSDATCTSVPATVQSGSTAIITCTYTATVPAAGERYQGDVMIRYTYAGSTLEQIATGGISGVVVTS